MIKRFFLLAVTIAFTAALLGCGSGDKKSTGSNEPIAPPAINKTGGGGAGAAPPPPPPPPPLPGRG